MNDPQAHEIQQAQALKLQAIGRFAGDVAHDFNNVLTVIRGNLLLLKERVDDGHAANEFLNDALLATDDGVELAKRLSSLCKVIDESG